MRVLNRQFAERLADLLDKHQVSNVKLARYLDVTGSLIGHYLSGDKLPYPDKIVKICDFFNSYGANINAGWLLFGDMSIMPVIPSDKLNDFLKSGGDKKLSIPVLDWDEINNWNEIREVFMRAKEKKEELSRKIMEIADVDLVHCFVLAVKGDAMIGNSAELPSFKEGAQILVDTGIDPKINDFVVAKPSNDEKPVFRQWIRADDGKHYLRSLNIQYPLIEFGGAAQIIGVVRSAQLKNYSVKLR